MEKTHDRFSKLLGDDAQKGRAENRRTMYSLKRMQDAYGHFVPRGILDLLGAQQIGDVVPGKGIELSMTVMFSDIRDFTTLSETLSSHQTFEFINSYLEHMEPPIHRHGGIIDKFIGDAVMGLFPGPVDGALDASISMLECLRLYNANRIEEGLTPIEIGIGLNTGLTTLGIIGHSERMETTVIGDCVNVASRVEGLTKKYKTPLLISENTLLAVADPGKYSVRFIDRVTVKGRLRPISVYEVFDGDDAKLADAKLAGLEVFEKAVAFYHLKEIDKALPLLETYVEAIPDDRAAAIYLDWCRRYLADGVYEGSAELDRRLAWSSSFNTGLEVIDYEHRQLLDNINDLSEALQEDDRDAVSRVLAFLESYTVKHFGTERALMEEFAYPFAKEHLAEHQRFIDRMAILHKELTSPDQDRLYSLFRVNLFLYDWLISHSTRVDKHLTAYIAEKRKAA